MPLAPAWNLSTVEDYLSGVPPSGATCLILTADIMHHITTCRRAALLALTVLLSAGSLAAQLPVPASAAPITALPAAASDTTEALPAGRATDVVRIDRDRLLRELRDSENQWATLRDQAARMKSNIGEVKDAISTASNREKQAKKEKREGDRITAQADKRRLERARALLEARMNLRAAQSEETRIQRDFLDAAVRAADAELAIAERREQVLPDDASQRAAFEELTSRWLQLLRTRAARAYDLEDRRFKVVEAQIDMLTLQRR